MARLAAWNILVAYLLAVAPPAWGGAGHADGNEATQGRMAVFETFMRPT